MALLRDQTDSDDLTPDPAPMPRPNRAHRKAPAVTPAAARFVGLLQGWEAFVSSSYDDATTRERAKQALEWCHGAWMMLLDLGGICDATRTAHAAFSQAMCAAINAPGGR